MTNYNNMHVASKATGLLDLVSTAVEDIDSGNHLDAERKLATIKEDSLSIILQGENRRQRLSEIETTKKREEEDLQYKISRLESSIQESRKNLVRLEARKSCMQDEFGQENRNLLSAQKELDDEHKRKKSREAGATAGVVATAVMGIVSPPTLFVTVPAVMGLGALVVNAEEKVANAQRKVRDKKSSISSLKDDISLQKRTIQEHEQKISKLKADHQEVMEQRGDLRSTIVFIQQAINFFNFLISSTEAGSQRANLLHKIVSKLHEKQEFTIHSSRVRVQTIAWSFRDAWNQVEQLVDDGEAFLSIRFSDEYMMRLSTA
jgi:DNA repair exonuclease SbcCD ATPase subunit